MTIETDITETLALLQKQVPAGFAMAFHVRFATPTLLFQTYPKTWSDYYSQNGLVMKDPTVAWGFGHLGTCRWSALDIEDPDGVMQQAADHGLRFGVTIAVEEANSRSFASFAHAAEEFTDGEIDGFLDHVTRLHRKTAELEKLSPEASRHLKRMAVTVGPANS